MLSMIIQPTQLMKTYRLILWSVCTLVFSHLSAAEKAAKVDFATQIKPLLTTKCINCHHAGALFGELNLENRTMAFKKRRNGPVILLGKPDSSALYLVLKMPPKNPKAMPPNGHRIADADVNLIYDWIKQGADWPKGAEGVIRPSKAVSP